MVRATVWRRLIAVVIVLAVAAGVTVGCGGSSDGGTIALLLPEARDARYATHDRPQFEKKVKELCGDCKIIYSNAEGDASKQQEQAETAISRGAKVLVVDPVSTALAAKIVHNAKPRGVPVISYDRLIENSRVDYYVSFNSEKVGELQGKLLAEGLKENGSPSGPIVLLTSTERGGGLRNYGARHMFELHGVKLAKEHHPRSSSATKAQSEVHRAIATLGKNGFEGVYAFNDEVAEGAIAAMKSDGIDPEEKPTTGEGATLAGLQRVLSGEQLMTVYEPFGEEADVSAEMAVELANGDEIPDSRFTAEPANGFRDVPAVLLEPVAVTKDNVKSTVIADNFVKPAELCAGRYASSCREAGIS